MFQSAYLINSTIFLVSLLTTLGVTLHGTQLDKATIAVVTPTASTTQDEGRSGFIKSDLHTHSERASFSQSIHNADSDNPRIQPRRLDGKRVLNNHRKLAKKDYHVKL